MNRTLRMLAAIGVASSMSNAAMAQSASGTMTVSATVSAGCSVSAATMVFDPISFFATTDVVADTAGSLLIACTAGTTPMLWSDSTRVLTGPGAGIVEIPFSLGQTPETALTDALPIIAAGEAIAATFTADGEEQAVPLHGLIKAADYADKEPGLYQAEITIRVDY